MNNKLGKIVAPTQDDEICVYIVMYCKQCNPHENDQQCLYCNLYHFKIMLRHIYIDGMSPEAAVLQAQWHPKIHSIPEHGLSTLTKSKK